ncbi:MAG: aminodeoxychorismate synthase component I [bacterium]|nr:aminodeoxychorismate synthase component I [bacterium]MDT8395312.1 aminodeoxychorismate synthase component I [bacterium]
MDKHNLLTLSSDDLASPGSILLENQLGDGWSGESALYTDPVQIIICSEPSDVFSTLESIDEALDEGFHVAGFISYEAGSALVPHQEHRDRPDFPLIWMGLYNSTRITRRPVQLPAPPAVTESLDPILDVTPDEFTSDVQQILDHIRAGETYQVNYTCRARFRSTLTPWELYLLLKRAQPVPYAAFLNCGSFSVLSQSPELFLVKRGDDLETKPMKGTAPRGKTRSKDLELVHWLAGSEKNRAENLMITDLMRNDIGRLAQAGTVTVLDPFHMESYRTLHQMTTGVRGKLHPECTLSQIISHTFPPGSITGAPKVRTMQIIRELERSPRKVYTGAVGRFGPDGDFAMNVAIRTIVMDRNGECEMGVGSGIVSDSDPSDEYRETVLKSSFLNHMNSGEVDLLETMLLDSKGILPFFEDHMNRMADSAEKLGYPFEVSMIRGALFQWLGENTEGPAVVRLRLDKRGDTWHELLPSPTKRNDNGLKVIFSSVAMDRTEPLLAHKTTSRKVYDQELAAARDEGFDEVLFSNTAGEMTEGAITSLSIRTSDGWITPALSCGLLPGTWRARYLAETGAREGSITPDVFQTALEVVVGNAVRGKMVVDMIVDEDGWVLYRKGQGPGSRF